MKTHPTRRDLFRIAAGCLSATAAGATLYGCSTSSNDTLSNAQIVKREGLMTQESLHYKTLSEVAASISAGDLDSVQVTAAILERVDTLEPKLHSYITVLGQQAMQRAAEMDALRSQGKQLGALHGVPIAVKDLCHKTGTPTTAGHSFRKDVMSELDATVVARLEASGAVILGKLATTEGAMVGYHRDFEVPRNPWGDHDRWPGVSSGGSGVATAAGLCFGSLGTDTGGSIRYPSAINGIVGLKPTWGRVSRHGVLDLAPTLDHVGPMTRSVRDAARMLSVIAGYDANDPTTLSNPVPDYESELERGVSGLRVGWDEKFATEDVEPYVADAVRSAITHLTKLGAEIIEIEVPLPEEDEVAAWIVIASAEAAAVHAATFPSKEEAYGTYFRQFLSTGLETSSVELAEANFARRRAVGRMAPVFNNIDLLVCPTLVAESFRYDPADAYGGIDLDRGMLGGVPFEWFSRNNRFITIWDFNGYPTLSLPCGFSPNGMPISLQLVGSPLDEALLCRAGFAFEQAHNFYLQHPVL